MSNDKCIDSPDKAVWCPVPLNCKFCLNPDDLDSLGDIYSIRSLLGLQSVSHYICQHLP